MIKVAIVYKDGSNAGFKLDAWDKVDDLVLIENEKNPVKYAYAQEIGKRETRKKIW